MVIFLDGMMYSKKGELFRVRKTGFKSQFCITLGKSCDPSCILAPLPAWGRLELKLRVSLQQLLLAESCLALPVFSCTLSESPSPEKILILSALSLSLSIKIGSVKGQIQPVLPLRKIQNCVHHELRPVTSTLPDSGSDSLLIYLKVPSLLSLWPCQISGHNSYISFSKCLWNTLCETQNKFYHTLY